MVPSTTTTIDTIHMVSTVLHWLPRHARLARTMLASMLLRGRAQASLPTRCISVEYPGSGIVLCTLQTSINVDQSGNQHDCQSYRHDFVRNLQGLLAVKLNVEPAAIQLFAGHDFDDYDMLSDHTTQYSNQLDIDAALAKLLVANCLVFAVQPAWAEQIKTAMNSLACWSVGDQPVMMPCRSCQVSHKCLTCRVTIGSQNSQTCLPAQIYAFDACKLYLQGTYCNWAQNQFVLAKPSSNLTAMRFDSLGFKHIDWSVLSSVAHLECYHANDLCWPPTTQRLANISAKQSNNIRLDQLCGYTSLTHLQLADCRLDTSIPPGIGQLVNLILLRITNCGLEGSIPDQLGLLTKLVEIDLSHNRLGGMLSCLDSLVNLESINLMRNKRFDNVPNTEKLVKLKHCDIHVSIHLLGFSNKLCCRSVVPENMAGIQLYDTFGKVGSSQLGSSIKTWHQH